MKIKSLLVAGLMLVSSLMAPAQTNSPLFVKGTMDIKFNSRNTTPPEKGVKDVYVLNINVANSALFHGTITDTPQLVDGYFTKTVSQPRSLNYNIECDVVNPKRVTETKNVGRMYGNVRIDSDGTYRYDAGNLVVDILPMGNAGGFSSKFGGLTLGKPLIRPANWLDTLQRSTINITRSINGKTTTVALKKYDKMEFRQHVIAAGPIASYQTVTVNGEMLYDYDKSCWFFNNVTAQYADGENVKIDRLTGTIRWIEKSGTYEFDIRVNEPPPSPTAVFEASTGSDESAFFETDTKVPALVGTMKYKDTKRGDTTMESHVDVDLIGQNISKRQLMVLSKIIIFSNVVPMNSD